MKNFVIASIATDEPVIAFSRAQDLCYAMAKKALDLDDDDYYVAEYDDDGLVLRHVYTVSVRNGKWATAKIDHPRFR